MKFICDFCHKRFNQSPSNRRAKTKFCSYACSGKWNKSNRKDRFFNNIQKTHGCWNWVGGKHKFGYGQFIGTSAHRWSYEFHIGKIPKEKFVLHNCDNPSCVNPKHLRVGTQKENISECSLRDRISFGSNRPQSKLTECDILKIRLLSKNHSQRFISKKFNVSQKTIFNIIHSNKWKRA